MTVLVVGGGGREHALVRKIKESPRVDSVHCCPGNGGIAYDAVCHNVAAMDIDGVVALAKEIQADLVVVAPDDPLVAGMVDALNAAGFATFGPRANAAIIEGSKVFSKDLMQKYHIPTAEYRVFDDPRAAIEYITEKNEFPTVIKADGLALGKGVLIPETLEEAVAGVKERYSVPPAIILWWRSSLPGRKCLCWPLPTASACGLWCPPWITSEHWTATRD